MKYLCVLFLTAAASMSSQLCLAQSSNAETSAAKTETPSKPASKLVPKAEPKKGEKSIKPIEDLDSFFKKAEQSTRDAYAKPDNCLPKLEEKSKPVS